MTKKVYVPPTAERLLLTPAETLAAWDWNFNSVWKSGYIPAAADNGGMSAVGIINGGNDLSEGWVEDSFIIVKEKN